MTVSEGTASVAMLMLLLDPSPEVCDAASDAYWNKPEPFDWSAQPIERADMRRAIAAAAEKALKMATEKTR